MRRAILFIVIILLIFLTLGCTIKDKQPEKLSVCGNNTCEPSETIGSCSSDCTFSEPWITLTDSNRYFVFENKEPFFPIGSALNGAYITYDATEEQFVEFMKSMKANGENFVRIDTEGFSWSDNHEQIKTKINNGTITFLESPAGTFNENYAKKLDKFFKLAKENDIYVELLIFSHSCTLERENNFTLFPYYTKNGGPISTQSELRSNELAKELFKQRLRFIVDRYGNSPNLFMYELFNEIDNIGCGSGDPNITRDWIEEMGSYLRTYEKEKYGKSHLIGASNVEFGLKQDYKFFLNASGVDVLQTHFYKAENLYNPVSVAIRIRDTLPSLLKESNYQKPYLENERAPIVLFVNNDDYIQHTQDYFVWAYIASGASGGGAIWHDMRAPSFVALTAKKARPFLEKIDFATFKGISDNNSIISSDKNVLPFVTRDNNLVVGWLMREESQSYTIEAINDWRNKKQNGALPPTVTDLEYLSEWKEVLHSQNADGNISALEEEISLNIQEISGLDSNLSNKISSALFGSRKELKSLLPEAKTEILESGGAIDKTEIKKGLLEILNKSIAYFEDMETKYGVLESTYIGHPFGQNTITINNLDDTNYIISWFDSTNGTWLGEETISGPNATIVTPSFSRHVAFLIKKVN